MGFVKIALDAMGGDLAPAATIGGALWATRDLGIEVILVGQEDVIREELVRQGGANEPGIEIHHAPDVVAMDDAPRVVFRGKTESSINRGARLIKTGDAVGFVSAGNTGATMAGMMREARKLDGVDRPCIAMIYPTQIGHAVIVDVGANVDCKPQHLTQFAAMGTVYYKALFGGDAPRVGVLSIGEEKGKGNELSKGAFKLLENSSLNFVGNVEGKDLFQQAADVIVCDGFIGNVLLKVSENMAVTFGHFLEESIRSSWIAQLGFILCKPALKKFMKRVDYTEYGGLPLLGSRGICIICHGRSTPKAIRNALRVASEFHKAGVNERIEQLLTDLRQEAEESGANGANSVVTD